jgi:hypothetical protein
MLIFSDKAIFKDIYIDDTSTDMNELRTINGRKDLANKEKSPEKKQKQSAITIMTFASSSTYFLLYG